MDSEVCKLIFFDEKNDILFYFDDEEDRKEVNKKNGIGGWVI